MKRLTILTHLLLALCLVPCPASARKPEDVYGGKILLSDKPFPSSAKSAAAFLATLRKQAKQNFWEDKKEKRWRVYYAAFFKRPLRGLSVTVVFFDISDGTRRMVETYEQYLNSAGQRALVGNISMQRGKSGFSPNSRILMVMQSEGQIIAEATFMIGGEAKQFSGKVVFTDDMVNQDGELPNPEQDED
ncbi:MAG: hypothetical protein V2A73_01050 [Pseudomonadota bacterium]